MQSCWTRPFAANTAAAGRPPSVAVAGPRCTVPGQLKFPVMSTSVYRFVGLETLPARLTDFDLQHFQLGDGDVQAIRQRVSVRPLSHPGGPCN